MVSASESLASGSGTWDTKQGRRWLSLVANRSISSSGKSLQGPLGVGAALSVNVRRSGNAVCHNSYCTTLEFGGEFHESPMDGTELEDWNMLGRPASGPTACEEAIAPVGSPSHQAGIGGDGGGVGSLRGDPGP